MAGTMKRLALWMLLFLPGLGQAYVGLCCGKCGGNMPMNIPGGGVPETHEFRFKLSPMFMHMESLKDGTEDIGTGELLGMPNGVDKFAAVPTSMDMTMVNLSVGYSFTERFFAGLMFMWQRNEMPMRFNQVLAQRFQKEGFTMTSQGMGDTMLMTKTLLYADDPLIPTRQASLFLGMSLPTGSIHETFHNHPSPMVNGTIHPFGMQLGSGTFDPIAGLLYQGSKSPWWWGANAMTTLRLYDNELGYRLGNELRLDLYAMRQLRYDLVAEFQLNGRWKGKIRGEHELIAKGEGHVDNDPAKPLASPLFDPDNYGGTELALTLGLQWQPRPLHIVNLQVGVPIYQDLNGPQLAEDFRVMLTYYLELPTAASIRARTPKSRLGF
ncbi:MAG: transporter [Gammaproteobacteria bacterium]|nr:MAG: transporter [Gammaproteobacteria bacterium]